MTPPHTHTPSSSPCVPGVHIQTKMLLCPVDTRRDEKTRTSVEFVSFIGAINRKTTFMLVSQEKVKRVTPPKVIEAYSRSSSFH